MQTTVSDFFVGLFADWDIGDYYTNKGGATPCEDWHTKIANRNGSELLWGRRPERHVRGSLSPNLPTTSFVESHQFGVVGSTGDLRMFIGSGPFTILPAAVQSVSFALLAAASVEGLQMRADSARALWRRITAGVEPVPDMHGPPRCVLAEACRSGGYGMTCAEDSFVACSTPSFGQFRSSTPTSSVAVRHGILLSGVLLAAIALRCHRALEKMV